MDLSQLNSIVPSGNSAAKTVANALASKRAVQATPKDSSTPPSSSGTTTDNSNITSNDFLTLLVSELKNQDPTQPTDPNQYITQLAQVNSLQQLISINQGIGTLDGALPAPSGSSGSAASGNAVASVADANVVSGLNSAPGNHAAWSGSTAS